MRNKNKYAAIGFVVSKFVLPIAKREAKRAAKRKARGAAGAVTRHPARTSVLVGSVIGGVGWLLLRGRPHDATSAGDDYDAA